MQTQAHLRPRDGRRQARTGRERARPSPAADRILRATDSQHAQRFSDIFLVDGNRSPRQARAAEASRDPMADEPPQTPCPLQPQ